MQDKISVLDKGYIRLVDHMGSDLSVVNAARVSFAKESKWEGFEVDTSLDNLPEEQKAIGRFCNKLADKDKRLINFLVEHGHTSPFRHCFVTLEIYAPIIVARQWWKYIVGSDHVMDGWNEMSRRYVTAEPEFYIPSAWRSAPENKKQGSGEPTNPLLDTSDLIASNLSSVFPDEALEEVIAVGLHYYNEALKNGICVEQARGFLPYAFMYTGWRWSASLQSLAHVYQQRHADEAQWEFRQYMPAMKSLVFPLFPVSMEALCGP